MESVALVHCVTLRYPRKTKHTQKENSGKNERKESTRRILKFKEKTQIKQLQNIKVT